MGDKLLLILNILGTLYLVYFAGVIVLGLFRKKREFPAAAPQKRIAAVIAARNEAGVIGEAVRTLLAQDYPRELFDIWVIPTTARTIPRTWPQMPARAFCAARGR